MGDGAEVARAEHAARQPVVRPAPAVSSVAEHPLLDMQQVVGNRVVTGVVGPAAPATVVRIVAYAHDTGSATAYLSDGGTVPVQILTNRLGPGSYNLRPTGRPIGDADAPFVRRVSDTFAWRQAAAVTGTGVDPVTVVVEPDPVAAFARLPAGIQQHLVQQAGHRPSGAELARLVSEGEEMVRTGITEADLALADDPGATIEIEDRLADIDLVESLRRRGFSNFPSREEFLRRLAVDVAQTSDFRRWWDDAATAAAWWREFPEEAARDWDTWGESVYREAKEAEKAEWLGAFRRIASAYGFAKAVGWVTVVVAGGFAGAGVPGAIRAASGVEFGVLLKAVTLSGLSANFLNSLVNRAQEGSATDANPLSVVAAAAVDATGAGKVFEAVFDTSLLTGQELHRSAAERWAAGVTGAVETGLNALGVRDVVDAPPHPAMPRGPAEPAPPPRGTAAAELEPVPAPAVEPVPALAPASTPEPTLAPAGTPELVPAPKLTPAVEATTPLPRLTPRGPVRSWFSRHILSAVTRGVLDAAPPSRGAPGAGYRAAPEVVETVPRATVERPDLTPGTPTSAAASAAPSTPGRVAPVADAAAPSAPRTPAVVSDPVALSPTPAPGLPPKVASSEYRRRAVAIINALAPADRDLVHARLAALPPKEAGVLLTELGRNGDVERLKDLFEERRSGGPQEPDGPAAVRSSLDDSAPHHLDEEDGLQVRENRPPVRVSPDQPGVSRGSLKDRMIAAKVAPVWATSPGDWNPHHVIPVSLEHHPVLETLRANGGWDNNAAVNGYPLPTRPDIPGAEHLPVHQVTRATTAPGAPPRSAQTARDLGGHPIWNDQVRARLDALEPLMNRPEELRAKVLDLIADLKGDIELARAQGRPVLF